MERHKALQVKGTRIPFGFWVCLSVIGLIAVFFYFTPWGSRYLLTGHFFPINHIEKLQNPARVVDWTEKGMNLSDGRILMPSGMKKLPEKSAAIEFATKNGIEVASDGKVHCLLKIHHWCGNDPVETDLRKIDLAKLLAFYHEGTSELKPYQYSTEPFPKDAEEYGWSVSDYAEMRMMYDPRFADLAADSREQSGRPN